MKTSSVTTVMLVSIVILALFIIPLALISTVECISTPQQVNVWALLVGGSTDLGEGRIYGAHEMFRDNYYMRHVLTEHFGVPTSHIMFLYAQNYPPLDYNITNNPINGTCIEVDGGNVINNVNLTIYEWLCANSDEDDIRL